MRGILQRYGNKDESPNDYVFPILRPGMSALDRHEAVASFIQFINNRMARIQQELGIERKVTTIVSRHSFSTQLKRRGASTEFIQEALGHTDKKTTENYLDSFENEVKRQYAGMLTAFKDE
jgi:site-specific recombinase XerD